MTIYDHIESCLHLFIEESISGIEILKDYEPNKYEQYPAPHIYTVFGDEYETQINDASGNVTRTINATIDVIIYYGFQVQKSSVIPNALELERRSAIADVKRAIRAKQIERFDGTSTNDGIAEFAPIVIVGAQAMHENQQKTYGTGIVLARVNYELFTLN